jgi:hypothetical protein
MWRKGIECHILEDKYAGKSVFIPRIPLSPPLLAELPFEFHRIQLLSRLAFALTINKSQGQTLIHVGSVLKDHVSTHGQLYTALSRVTNGANLHLIVPEEARAEGKLKNVVYR